MTAVILPKDSPGVPFGKVICPRRVDQRKGLGLFSQVLLFPLYNLLWAIFYQCKD